MAFVYVIQSGPAAVAVCLQGYGEVAVPPAPSPSAAAASGSGVDLPAAIVTAAAPGSDAAAIQAAVDLAGQPAAAGTNSSSSSSSLAAGDDQGGLAVARKLLQYAQGACPFPAGPLPLSPAEIGGDGSMFSAYLHEAIPNCIFWGLFKSGALRTVVKDGNIPQLRLITDLFGGLIPELPKHYSKRGMLLEIDMLEPPQVRQLIQQDGC